MPPEGTINDVPEVDVDTAAAALLKRWSKPAAQTTTEVEPPDPEPVEHEEEEEVDEQDEHQSGDEEDEERHEDDEEEDKDKSQRQLATDDHEVVVTVDGQEHRVSVKDLKRLAGQEVSLTRKSQEVATLRTEAAEKAERHVTALNAMVKRAEERYAPYAQIDWALAAAKLSSEEYSQLKAAADTIKSDVDYYKTELGTASSAVTAEQAKEHSAAAKACLEMLTDASPTNPHHIEGWDDKLYNDIRQYAVSMGVPQPVIDRAVDPVAFKIMHKAMLYDKAQKTAVKKLASAPKNVNKTPTNDGNAKGAAGRNAMERLRQSGDPDDAAAVLLERWRS